MKKSIAFLYSVIFIFCSIHITGATTIIFEDNFNIENSGNYIYNYDSFANWNVSDGTVDLLNANHGGFEDLTLYGMFIDLDGTAPTPNAGRMESKTTFIFDPDYTYYLSFDLAGSHTKWGLQQKNTVNVSLGNIYNKEITLDTPEPFQTFQHNFNVASTTNANMIFDHQGGDWTGLLLDNITITSTPIPDAPIMLLLGSACLIGLGGVRRKIRK